MTRSYSVLFTLAVFLISLGVTPADARGDQRTAQANADAIKELMGTFKFGMTRKQVIAVVRRQIDKRYDNEINATNDVYAQDTLRRKRDAEMKELVKTKVDFDGKKTGWDVSIVDDQFFHGIGESMMVHWENNQGRNQRRFFFFFKDRLYKMVVALELDLQMRQSRGFDGFVELMENRFGNSTATDTGVAWRTRTIGLEAMNKLAFYNAICLVLTDVKLTARVESVRADNRKADKGRNPVIRAILAGENDPDPELDEGSEAIEKIIGQ